jgi:hypothetical protein
LQFAYHHMKYAVCILSFLTMCATVAVRMYECLYYIKYWI